MFGEEIPEWSIEFVSITPTSGVDGAVLGGAIGGAAFVLTILFCVVLFVIMVKARNNSKKKDMRFIKLMTDMERMEVEMAVTCKTGNITDYIIILYMYWLLNSLSLSLSLSIAFTELQTDLGELVTDEALESQQLPFQSFPTYATKIFFPHANIDHPVLNPPRVS